MSTPARDRARVVWAAMRRVVWTQVAALVLVLFAAVLVLVSPDRFPAGMVMVIGAIALSVQSLSGV